MNESTDFAIIGHQSSWKDIQTVINGIRKDKNKPLSLSDIKSIFPALPPRSLFDIKIHSIHLHKKLNGKYIETFIPPDHLNNSRYLRENLEKVKLAANVSVKLNIPITSLGGFTSILSEGNLDYLPFSGKSIFTTGNTLTAAFIIEGVKQACNLLGKSPKKSNLLIIGATGDIGIACTRYFKLLFRKVMMVARNETRLSKLAQKLQIPHISTDLQEFSAEADVIIAAASSMDIKITNLKPGVVIADTGYPKNISADHLPPEAYIFHSGMAHVEGGYSFRPGGYMKSYSFPYKNIGHGCVLESAVLAFENRHESYSSGRGRITIEKIEEILKLSRKHGITLAPFYNDKGLWTENRMDISYEK